MAYGLRRSYSLATEVSKAIGVLTVLGSTLFGVWATTLGPGVDTYIKDAAGSTEILRRVERIEQNLPPLKVVEWEINASKQLGWCTATRCDYQLTAARTQYGSTCGAVTGIEITMRKKGDTRPIEMAYRNFTPVELDLVPRSFVVDLAVKDYHEPGEYYWRAEVTYATCSGINEPIPRFSPWFPVRIHLHE